jgi:hypothetical protein
MDAAPEASEGLPIIGDLILEAFKYAPWAVAAVAIAFFGNKAFSKWCDMRKAQTVQGVLDRQHPGKPSEQIVNEHADLQRELDRLHKRIDRVSEDSVERAATNAANIKSLDKRVDKIAWPDTPK